jgi:hypothetical protein
MFYDGGGGDDDDAMNLFSDISLQPNGSLLTAITSVMFVEILILKS